jgi:hypothetical protein
MSQVIAACKPLLLCALLKSRNWDVAGLTNYLYQAPLAAIEVAATAQIVKAK